jgi:4'-phosphopantetheinyl transferase
MLNTQELRWRWTVARGALRRLLAAYVGAAPESLVFTSDANGRLKIADFDNAPSFSLSHTGGLAFVAVARSGCLGIDAEMLRPDIEWLEVSRQFFSQGEVNEIEALPPEARIAAFFACWTRKEAYLKARGVGLAELDRVQVTVRPHVPASLVHVEGSPEEPRQWILQDLSEPGVVVTLAVRSPEAITVRRFDFSLSSFIKSGHSQSLFRRDAIGDD